MSVGGPHLRRADMSVSLAQFLVVDHAYQRLLSATSESRPSPARACPSPAGTLAMGWFSTARSASRSVSPGTRSRPLGRAARSLAICRT
jgi:hypothetical protein